MAKRKRYPVYPYMDSEVDPGDPAIGESPTAGGAGRIITKHIKQTIGVQCSYGRENVSFSECLGAWVINEEETS